MSSKSESETEINPLGDLDDENEAIENGTKPRERRSKQWNFFDVVDSVNSIAVCNFCRVQISFKSSVSSLGKHLNRLHMAELEANLLPDSHAIERYFEISEGKARCKACSEELAEDHPALQKHVWSHNKHDFEGKLDDSVLEEDIANRSIKKRRPSKMCSAAWEHCDVVDSDSRLAQCKTCKKVLSYSTGVSNLMKHVRRKHSGVETDDNRSIWVYFKCLDEALRIASCLICRHRVIYSDDLTELRRHLCKSHPRIGLDNNTVGKTFMMTNNGELFEVEESETDDTEANVELENENESDTNEVYVNDEIFDETELKTKTPLKRKSDEAHATQKKPKGLVTKKEPEDSIEIFGRYMVSLLKMLPKKVSDRLQFKFVKKI